MNDFHCLPDEMLYKIFSYASAEIVDCLEMEIPSWVRFKRELKTQSNQAKEQCHAVIPGHIITNYKNNINYEYYYGWWQMVLQGWKSLSKNSPWIVKKDVLKTLVNRCWGKYCYVYGMFGHTFFYVQDYCLRSYDIYTKEDVNTGVEVPANSYEIEGAIFVFPKFEGHCEVRPHFVYLLKNLWTLVCVKLNKESENETLSGTVPYPVKICNIDNTLFVTSCKSVYMFRITKDQGLHKEGTIQCGDAILDIEPRNLDLIILTETKLIIWSNHKCIKKINFIEPEIKYNTSITFFENEIILHEKISKKFSLVLMQEETTCILKSLGFSQNRQAFLTLLKTGHFIDQNINSELELKKLQYDMKELMNSPDLKFAEISLPYLSFHHVSYINNTIYIFQYYDNESYLYRFSK